MGRIGFANSLRGIAAVSVLVSHFFCAFWFKQAAVATLTHAEPLVLQPPHWIKVLNAAPYVNWGSFGVALFFLIGLMLLFWVVVILPMSRRQRKEQEQMLATLKRAGYTVIYDILASPSEFERKLQQSQYDLILCDHNIPSFGGAAM